MWINTEAVHGSGDPASFGASRDQLDSLRRLLWMTNFAESFIYHFMCLCNSAFKF